MNILNQLKNLAAKVKERRKIDNTAIERSKEYVRRVKQAAKIR